MKTDQDKLMKTIERILGVMMLAVVLFLILGELLLPKENAAAGYQCRTFEAQWRRMLPDGTWEMVSLPEECDAERGEVVRIETTLPEDLEDIWFCARASQQDMKIYVGEALRKEYSTKDTRPFGINSASAYVFFPVTEADAGKLLAIETVSNLLIWDTDCCLRQYGFLPTRGFGSFSGRTARWHPRSDLW